MVANHVHAFPPLSRRRLMGAALAAPLVSLAPRSVSGVSAQTPEAAGGSGGLDLAAIPPRGADIPDGFFPNSDGLYESSPFSFLPSTENEVMAVRRYHQGYPTIEGSETEFRGFFFTVTEFASVEEAEASFALLQDIDAIMAADAAITSLTPLEPLGLSDGAEYLAMTQFDDRVNDPGGWVGTSILTVFRVENLVLEVSADHFMDPNALENAATVTAATATPMAADETLANVARSAGEAGAARARAVLAGDPVDGVNYDLRGMLLRIQETWPESGSTFEQYRDAGTTFDGTLVSFDDSLVSGYLRSLTTNPEPDQFDPPFVTVSITQLDSAETMATFLTAFEGAIDDLQTAGPTPRGVPRTFTTAPAIPGADAVLAYFSRLPDATADDSAGIVFTMGAWFAQIDVQGIGANESLAAASELALAQATCSTGGSCAAPAVPEVMAG